MTKGKMTVNWQQHSMLTPDGKLRGKDRWVWGRTRDKRFYFVGPNHLNVARVFIVEPMMLYEDWCQLMVPE